ncbi:MAG TPA: hypothetical protein VMP10_02935 [Chloroflexota bacterium]|nr:hypothetical protein [Chloroflexota bacterium]
MSARREWLAASLTLVAVVGALVLTSRPISDSLVAELREPRPVGTVVVVTIGAARATPTAAPVVISLAAGSAVPGSDRFKIELVMPAPTATPAAAATTTAGNRSGVNRAESSAATPRPVSPTAAAPPKPNATPAPATGRAVPNR